MTHVLWTFSARFARCALRLLALIFLAECTSPHYVGSIGRDGTYSNRGYGLAVRLEANGLGERWDPIDPTAPERVPKAMRPKEQSGPIDLDGDGYLTLTERQTHFTPALRLMSRTSSTARIEVDVTILGGNNKKAPLDVLMANELKVRAETSSTSVSSAIAKMQKRRVAPDFAARVAELASPTSYQRIALIDHDDFLAEEGIHRRQLIKVVLIAARRRDSLIADHDRLLDAVILNRRSSTETVREQW